MATDDRTGAAGAGLCFVIGPVGLPDTDTRKHADQLFTYVIEPAATECGLARVERADHIEGSGVISSEIVTRLTEAEMVVADLSMTNPNAYYELAIRHVLRLPFAHLMRAGDELPFDLAQNRAIRFDLRDLDSVAAARAQLVKTIRAELEKGPNAIETPFTNALDLQALSAQPNADENPALAELSRVVARIESMQRDLLMQVRDINEDSRFADRRWFHQTPRRQILDERNLVSQEVERFRRRLATLTAERTLLSDRLSQDVLSDEDRASMMDEAVRLDESMATARAELARFESRLAKF